MAEVKVNIVGYRQLTPEEQAMINKFKALEAEIAAHLDVALTAGAEPRDVALARTSFQQGMFWLVRSVAKPDSPLNNVMRRGVAS